ncbi:MAG TPA: VOC family protein [Chitinophaga sp.]|uniref:VOC family protein n=1 Tax=Chitinophaga sp. TaxID=1869181 RepID=UPI002BB30004|nr:VOC family protein [Chitinophaga sp.]HVI48765.1 VOC family protein [Chitinophaga sp.]
MATKIISKKIVSCLWFAMEAEEAVKFYTSIFKNSSVGKIMRYTGVGEEVHGMSAGTVMTIDFALENQGFVALNAGPVFKFNEAISFIVYCDNQEEIDHYWNKLGEGGDEHSKMCGWLKDKFGLSWQIVPVYLEEIFDSATEEQYNNVMTAVLQSKKLEIKVLEAAYNK